MQSMTPFVTKRKKKKDLEAKRETKETEEVAEVDRCMSEEKGVTEGRKGRRAAFTES